MWIRFSNDDRIAISAGGHDRGLYQWRTIGMNKEDMDSLEKDKLVLACMEHLIKKRRCVISCLEGISRLQCIILYKL